MLELLLHVYLMSVALVFLIVCLGALTCNVPACGTELAVILILVPLAWPLLLVVSVIRYLRFGHT